ncbi:MAG: tryptophan synthase subunit alpha [Lachnospiraceae bacterium]
MNRIETKLAQLKEKNEKAFITYITAGLPDMAHTAEIIKAQERGGCDIVELGVPFSDPAADGPVIQDASYHAILGGANLKKTFELVKTVRDEGVEMPIIFMLYYNTIMHYGLEAFVKKCEEVGVDGMIIPDLPMEEQGELKQYLNPETSPLLIQLVSPVSKDRVPEILKDARGFVYCVSSMGVTGQEATFHKEILSYLSAVKKESKIPVMMGFGIRTAADVAPMKDSIDGAIVGSHFIKLLEENNFEPKAAEEYCATFKKELNQL